MKVLLTGASGTVGEATLKKLLKSNDVEVIAFDLNSSRAKKILKNYRSSIKIIYGDITNIQDIVSACSNIDVVIHLAAIIPPVADDHPDLARKINTDGTKNLIDSLKEKSPGAFFIYASSVSVYGDRLSDPDISVGDPLKPSEGDEYGITKINAEKLVQNSGLDYTIFRVTAVMGATNHKISKLMFHMPLATPIQLITPADCGLAFANAINKKSVLNNNIFNLSGGSSCNIIYRDLLSQSFTNAGLGKFDLPEKAFAEKNFHCGYYADGDILEDILHFRSETVDDYFMAQKASISVLTKSITSVLRKPIKLMLAAKSEPWQALRNADQEKIDKYFIQESMT